MPLSSLGVGSRRLPCHHLFSCIIPLEPPCLVAMQVSAPMFGVSHLLWRSIWDLHRTFIFYLLSGGDVLMHTGSIFRTRWRCIVLDTTVRSQPTIIPVRSDVVHSDPGRDLCTLPHLIPPTYTRSASSRALYWTWRYDPSPSSIGHRERLC